MKNKWEVNSIIGVGGDFHLGREKTHDEKWIDTYVENLVKNNVKIFIGNGDLVEFTVAGSEEMAIAVQRLSYLKKKLDEVTIRFMYIIGNHDYEMIHDNSVFELHYPGIQIGNIRIEHGANFDIWGKVVYILNNIFKAFPLDDQSPQERIQGFLKKAHPFMLISSSIVKELIASYPQALIFIKAYNNNNKKLTKPVIKRTLKELDKLTDGNYFEELVEHELFDYFFKKIVSMMSNQARDNKAFPEFDYVKKYFEYNKLENIETLIIGHSHVKGIKGYHGLQIMNSGSGDVLILIDRKQNKIQYKEIK